MSQPSVQAAVRWRQRGFYVYAQLHPGRGRTSLLHIWAYARPRHFERVGLTIVVRGRYLVMWRAGRRA